MWMEQQWKKIIAQHKPSWEKCTAPPHVPDLRSNLQLLKREHSTHKEYVRNRPHWSKIASERTPVSGHSPCWSRVKWGTGQLASLSPGQLQALGLNGRNCITWGGRKHYTQPHNFLSCLLAPWTNSDRQSWPHSEKKRKLKLRNTEKKNVHKYICLMVYTLFL